MWESVKISIIIGTIAGIVMAIVNLIKKNKKSKCPICDSSLLNNIGNVAFDGKNLCKSCSRIIEIHEDTKIGSKLNYDLDYLKSIVEDAHLDELYIKKVQKNYFENENRNSFVTSHHTEHLKMVNLANNCLKNKNRYGAIQFYVEALKIGFKAETQKALNNQLDLFNKENNKNIKYNPNEKMLYDEDTGEII